MAKRIQRIREWLIYQLMTPVRWGFEAIMRRRNQIVLYCVMGNGIGDALAISTILKALNVKTGVKGIVFSMYPDLFLHNPMVVKNLDYRAMASWRRSLLKSFLRAMRGEAVFCIGGEVWTVGTSPLDVSDLRKQRGKDWVWLEKLLPDSVTAIDFSKATPAIYFSIDEVKNFELKYQGLPRPYGLLKATVGVNRPDSAQLKNWKQEGFAAVVHSNPQVAWIQVGELGEPVVAGTINLLGSTNLRELLWLLSQARVLVSVEGFLTHASAAFNVPSVVPFTGVHEAKGLWYPSTIPLLPEPMPLCAPCWSSVCHVPDMPCRADISVEAVLTAVSYVISSERPQ